MTACKTCGRPGINSPKEHFYRFHYRSEKTGRVHEYFVQSRGEETLEKPSPYHLHPVGTKVLNAWVISRDGNMAWVDDPTQRFRTFNQSGINNKISCIAGGLLDN